MLPVDTQMYQPSEISQQPVTVGFQFLGQGVVRHFITKTYRQVGSRNVETMELGTRKIPEVQKFFSNCYG